MSNFSAHWLDLREPLDAASRAAQLCTPLIEALTARRRGQARLVVVDLGAGSGANLRYAAPRLGGPQDWLLVESDPALREAVADRMQAWATHSPDVATEGELLVVRGAQFECRVRNLALDLATQLDQLPISNSALLTASALLDLVSEQWLQALARRAADAAAIVWFALTYDGRIQCVPAEAEDAEVRELFNLHQLQDKGFGPALGPGAAQRAAQVFTQQGYDIRCAPSQWRIRPQLTALQHALVTGWFDAACEIAPHRAAVLHSWLVRRRAHIDGSRSELRVGHVDMVGHPALDESARYAR